MEIIILYFNTVITTENNLIFVVPVCIDYWHWLYMKQKKFNVTAKQQKKIHQCKKHFYKPTV